MGAIRVRPTYANIVGTMALVLAASGVAVATVPDGSGIIHGCYQKKGGTLRVLVGGKQKCRARSEVALSWNQQGVAGTPGANGSRGPQGVQGPAGSDAQFNGASAGGDLTGTFPDPTIAPGTITPSMIGAVPAVRAVQHTEQSIPQNTVTSLNFDTNVFDSGGMHSTTTHTDRLVAPASGVYLITASVRWQSVGSATFVYESIGTNDTSIVVEDTKPVTPGTSTYQSVSGVAELSAGEFATTAVMQNSSAAQSTTGNGVSTAFSMVWLGPLPH